jgi:hypothetical protein
MRQLIVVAVLLAWGGLTVSTQVKRYVTLQLELPNGDVRDVRTPEGPRTAHVQLWDGQEWQDLYLDLTVVEGPTCAVIVSIRDSRQTDASWLDELQLNDDGIMIGTSTVPEFGLALRAIDGC